jgi:hypothetical protein
LFELQEEQQDNVPLRNCEILPLNFGSKAFDQRRFANLRAELWWELGEKIRNGQIELPYDLDLMAELAAPAMETTSNRRFILESKESLKRRGVDSPDAGDALALAAYDYENFPRACAW